MHFRILILGAGTGGISLAAKLQSFVGRDEIGIVDPSETHYYQPFWTLVGGGVGTKEQTKKFTKNLIPSGVRWIKAKVQFINPTEKYAACLNHNDQEQKITFDFLVVATGLELQWDKIQGLNDNLGKKGITTIYEYNQVDHVKEQLYQIRSGKALFVMPPTPIKCAGAPQKIMYLADDIFRSRGVREQIEIHFISAGKAIFGVPEFAKSLDKVVAEKKIKTHFQHKLKSIDADRKKATFEVIQSDGSVSLTIMDYDFIHIVPTMSAHHFISESGLAFSDGDQKGWLAVNKGTLQHLKYPYIFGLGDVTGVPNSKTGAAIRKQYPIVTKNLLAVMKGKNPEEIYDGYSSCPIVIERGKVILAEFGYDGKLMPTFPIDQTQPSYLMWVLKRWILPIIYWYGMLRGRI